MGRDCGASKRNHHTKGWSSSKDYTVYMMGFGRESSIMSSFWKIEQFQQVLLPIRPLDKKYPESVNRKHIIFHHDNTRSHVSLMIRQKL